MRSDMFCVMAAMVAVGLAGCQAGEPAAEKPQADDDEQAKGGAAMTALEVSSSAFDYGMAIPAAYTCEGEDISPPLNWSAGPEGTACYALIMDDPDAPMGTWVHWVAYNLAERTLAEGVSAKGRASSVAVTPVSPP